MITKRRRLRFDKNRLKLKQNSIMGNLTIVFSIIKFLKLEENTTFNFFGWTVTNNRDLILRNIPNMDELLRRAGEINVSLLFEEIVAFTICDFCENCFWPASLHTQASNINAIIRLLWLQQDNCMFSPYQFSQNLVTHHVITNTRDDFTSNANGEYSTITMSNSVLSEIKNLELDTMMPDLLSSSQKKTKSTRTDAHRAGLEHNFKSLTRIQRAYLILSIARNTSFLPMKIGFYVNVLECLLLNQTAELKYRLQINTATFIGNSKDEKEEIMAKVNRAYNIRSSFFHGSSLKNGIEDLQKVSSDIDDIVRKTILKAIDAKSVFNNSNQNVLDDFFKSNIFS